nr:immunoglobulin light chain junction region [Macaca mulatta]
DYCCQSSDISLTVLF